MSSNFAIHTDDCHIDSGENSVVVHLNLFRTSDYIPGLTGSGPWNLDDKKVADEIIIKDNSILNESPFVIGYLGERFVYYSKCLQRFLTNKERDASDRRGINVWSNIPTKAICRLVLEYQGVKLTVKDNVQKSF